jgi:hypothetical protein
MREFLVDTQLYFCVELLSTQKVANFDCRIIDYKEIRRNMQKINIKFIGFSLILAFCTLQVAKVARCESIEEKNFTKWRMNSGYYDTTLALINGMTQIQLNASEAVRSEVDISMMFSGDALSETDISILVGFPVDIPLGENNNPDSVMALYPTIRPDKILGASGFYFLEAAIYILDSNDKNFPSYIESDREDTQRVFIKESGNSNGAPNDSVEILSDGQLIFFTKITLSNYQINSDDFSIHLRIAGNLKPGQEENLTIYVKNLESTHKISKEGFLSSCEACSVDWSCSTGLLCREFTDGSSISTRCANSDATCSEDGGSSSSSCFIKIINNESLPSPLMPGLLKAVFSVMP